LAVKRLSGSALAGQVHPERPSIQPSRPQPGLGRLDTAGYGARGDGGRQAGLRITSRGGWVCDGRRGGKARRGGRRRKARWGFARSLRREARLWQASALHAVARGVVPRSRTPPTDLELYLKQIDESPLLSADEEKHLARKIINEGCMASREHMIRSNLRLVVAIAKRYMNRGLSLQDLIEEGNVGLVKAVEGFDPDMGARFSTYGCWWIKQGIKRALINAVQPIHIPAYMVELIAKWKRASRLLEEKLGRTPTVQELAEEMDLPAKKVRIIKKAVKASRRPSQTGSGAEGEGPMLSEMVADARTPSPQDQVLLADDLETIGKLLEAIDDREAKILRLRYGLNGDEPLTLKEIGVHVGLTRERVRQIEIEALKKLNARLESDRPLSAAKAQVQAKARAAARAAG